MKKIMMAIAPLLILTSCANQASFAKLNKYALNKPNNKGAEGAAYTIIVVSKFGIPEEPVRFIFDRPFAYAVTTKEGIPVFMGKATSLPNA